MTKSSGGGGRYSSESFEGGPPPSSTWWSLLDDEEQWLAVVGTALVLARPLGCLRALGTRTPCFQRGRDTFLRAKSLYDFAFTDEDDA